MRIPLSNGGCALRYMCDHVNTPKCKPLPRLGNDFIECWAGAKTAIKLNSKIGDNPERRA